MNIEQLIQSLKEVGVDFGECALDTNVQDAKGKMAEVLRYLVGEGYSWLPAYDEVAGWLEDNKKKGLLLMGSPGLGKTLLATKVIPVILLGCMGKILHPISAYDMNRMEKEFAQMSIVVLDDIGVEDDKNDYGERKRVFADIVDRAERRGDILIITTNLTPKEIEQKYSERILDRLKGLTRFVVFKGKSFRK